ncbi:hypothetical protein D6C98_09207, partial [Aureobasidium pullulans]
CSLLAHGAANDSQLDCTHQHDCGTFQRRAISHGIEGSAPCSSDIKNCPNNCVFEALSSLLTLWRAGMMASSILTCQQYYRDAAEDMWYSMCHIAAFSTHEKEDILEDRSGNWYNPESLIEYESVPDEDEDGISDVLEDGD